MNDGYQSDYSTSEFLDNPVSVKLLTCPNKKHCT